MTTHTVPPPAQAFELGMHAALKAAGVKTAADAEAFFKIARDIQASQATEQRRRETFEIGVRGVLSNAGIKTAEAQDAMIKEAYGLLDKLRDTGGEAVDKAKDVGGAVAGKAKAPAVAGGLRDFIKKKLKTLGIG